MSTNDSLKSLGRDLLWRAKVRWLAYRGGLKVIIGSSGTVQRGWIATDADKFNLLQPDEWQQYFGRASVTTFLAEHVWEHLTEAQGEFAAKTCLRFLHVGGRLRIAVPDGLHPDPNYIEWVRAGGSGAGADDHKVLYTYRTLSALLENCGFRVELLEYFDEAGKFHFRDWDARDGLIRRSSRYDERNQDGGLHFTSIVLDAFKNGSAK